MNKIPGIGEVAENEGNLSESTYISSMNAFDPPHNFKPVSSPEANIELVQEKDTEIQNSQDTLATSDPKALVTPIIYPI